MTMFRSGCTAVVFGAIVLAIPHASAQMSLTTAVDLALRNSPKVRMAEADVTKAKASLSESKDAFVPTVTASGGEGKATGPPLSVPEVFIISAQSLVFNFSQRDYIRSARAGITAAEFSLNETRNAIAEDTVSTYVGLDNAQRRKTAVAEAVSDVDRLVQITEDRFNSGVDPHIDLTRAKRTAVMLHLQQLQLDDEIDAFAEHLTNLTGITTAHVETVSDSIPAYATSPSTYVPAPESDGIRAAYASATAKSYVAQGDRRYRWRPQFSLGATYSRIDTAFTNYADYYPAFAKNNNFNALNFGIQITVPLLDMMHQARARNSAAEALRLHFQADDEKTQFLEGRAKLRRSVAELSARAELASLDRGLAQDELDAVKLQLQADASSSQGAQMTPKDEQNALLQERQKYVDMLSAELQLRQTEISLMRQNGQLGDWLHSAVTTLPEAAPGSLPAAPSLPVTHP